MLSHVEERCKKLHFLGVLNVAKKVRQELGDASSHLQQHRAGLGVENLCKKPGAEDLALVHSSLGPGL